MNACVSLSLSLCTYPCMYACERELVCTRAREGEGNTRTHIHTHTHTHTRTHMHTCPPRRHSCLTQARRSPWPSSRCPARASSSPPFFCGSQLARILPCRRQMYPSIYLSIYLSIHVSIHPSIHLSIYLSIYLTMSPAKILIFAATSGPIISTILATAFSLDVEHTATVLPASSSSVTCHVYMDTY